MTGTMLHSSSGRCAASAELIPSSADTTPAASAALALARHAGSAASSAVRCTSSSRVLRLHALDVHGARRRALLEGVPQHGVLALVVGVQSGREHREMVGDDLGVHGVALGDPVDQRAALAEAGLEHPMDLGHAACVAGLGDGTGRAGRTARRRRRRAHVRVGRHSREAGSRASRLRSSVMELVVRDLTTPRMPGQDPCRASRPRGERRGRVGPAAGLRVREATGAAVAHEAGLGFGND